MKKTINGVVCDTETAVMVAADRHCWQAFLYKNTTGEFFVYRPFREVHEGDRIELVNLEDAICLYEGMLKKRLDYKTAFGKEIEAEFKESNMWPTEGEKNAKV